MTFAGNFVNVVGPLFVMEVDASESPKLRDFAIAKMIEVDYLKREPLGSVSSLLL
jgi:hypothetical protein